MVAAAIARHLIPKIEAQASELASAGNNAYLRGNPANNVYWDSALQFYFYRRASVATPNTWTGTTSIASGVLNSAVAWALSSGNLIDANNQEAAVTAMLVGNGQGSDAASCLMATTVMVSGCELRENAVESQATGFGAFTGTINTPSVTPTVDGSLVIAAVFLDNDVAAMVSSDVTPTPDYFNNEATAVGGDGTTMIIAAYDCPASVAVQFAIASRAGASNYYAVACVIPPAPMTRPMMVPGSFVRTITGATPGNITMPTSATCDIQFGDILVVAYSDRLRNTNALGNTGAFDHYIVDPGPDGATMALKRINTGAELDAVAASPPTWTCVTPANGVAVAFVLRGIQRAGTYLTASATDRVSQASPINLPITITDTGDTMLTFARLDDDDLLQVHDDSGGDDRPNMLWWWGDATDESYGVGVTLAAGTGSQNQKWTWSGTQAICYAMVALATAALTHEPELTFVGLGGFTATLTSESGATFLSPTFEGRAEVTMDRLKVFQPAYKPTRHHVWVHNYLDQRVNVITE